MKNERNNTMKNITYMNINSNSSKIRGFDDLKIRRLKGLSVIHYSLLIILFLLPLGKVWGQTTINYNFEGSDRNSWTFVNGSAVNRWCISKNSSAQNGGTYSLYVTNGTAGLQTATAQAYEYTISGPSVVWAYIDIVFPASSTDYTFSFDWKCGGESIYDYFSVYLGDASVPTAAVSGSPTQPANTISFTNNAYTTGGVKFNGYNGSSIANTSWYTFSQTLSRTTYSGTTKRLYFAWKNDNSVGTMPPAAIDNIKLVYTNPCTTLATPTLTATPVVGGVSLSWGAVSNASGYTIEWGSTSACSDGSQTVTGTSTTISFTSGTRYFRVRANGNGSTYCDSEYSTVRSAAPISRTLSVSSGSVACSGSGTVLTATATGFSSPRYTWSASPSSGAGLPSSHTNLTTNTITVTPTTGGNYTYTCSVTEGGSGTATTASVTISVPQTPTVTISPATATVCGSYDITPSINTKCGEATYAWSRNSSALGVTTQNYTATTSGTYIITVTNSALKQYDLIVQNGVPAIVVVAPTASATGKAVPIGTGGIGSNTSAGNIAYNAAANLQRAIVVNGGVRYDSGNRTGYVIPIQSCTATASINVTINEPPTLTHISGRTSQDACVDNAIENIVYHYTPANASVSVSGLPSGVDYTANSGVLTISGSPTVSATYSYTVTVSSGSCPSAAPLTGTIKVADKPEITVNSPQVCKGSSVTLQAGSASTYTWSPTTYLSSGTGSSVSFSSSSSSVVAGNSYTVTVTGTSGNCSNSTVATVTVVGKVTPTFTNPGPICSGAPLTLPTSSNNNSNLTGSAVTGTWSPAVDNTHTTTYTFTPTASPDQCASTATMSVTVNQLPTVTVNSPTVCKGTAASLTASGAASYTWSPSTNLSATTGANVNYSSSVNAGTYNVTVTGTSNGCTASATATVTVKDKVTPTFTNPGPICSGASLTLPISSNNNSNLTGSAVTGTWSPAVDNTHTTTYTFTPTASPDQCASTATMQVVVEAKVTPTFTNPGPYCMGETPADLPVCTTTDPISNTTIIGSWSPSTISTASEGSETYTYIINEGQCANNGEVSVVVNNCCSLTADAQQVDGLCGGKIIIEATTENGTGIISYSWDNGAGADAQYIGAISGNTYTVHVSDEAGCTAEAWVTPVQTGYPGITPSFDAITCNGETTDIVLSVIGGLGEPYTYQWEESTSTTNTVEDVTAGTYHVTVSDANCSATALISVTEPNAITFDVTTTPQVCNTLGTATVSNEQGGDGSYSYAWSNSSDEASVELSAGNYSVTVSDGNGCWASAVVTIGSSSTTVSFDAIPSNPTCSYETGSIVVNNFVGASPYTVAWDGGSVNNITGTYTITGLTTGDYTVIVTDADGCGSTQSGLSITVPSEIAFTISSTPQICTTLGSATVEIANSGNYSYVWHNSANEVVGSNSNELTDIAAGNYSITVTSTATGCYATEMVTVGNNPTTVTFSADATSPACSYETGSIAVADIVGTANYTVAWDGGSENGISDDHHTISNLGTGNYTVTVTDANGCSSTQSGLSITVPSEIAFTISSTPQICTTLGSATVEIANSGNYSYVWHNSSNEVVGSNSNELTDVAAGSYSVTVTSTATGCYATETVTVGNNPTNVTFSADATSPACSYETGSIAVTDIVGTANYTVAWNAGSENGISDDHYTISNLVTGNYIVTVTDANGCSAMQSGLSVSVPNEITYSVSAVEQICSTAGSITLESVSGGTGGYSYQWSNLANEVVGNGTNVLSGVNADVYNVTVTDASGCEKIDAITLTSSSGSVSFTPVSHDLLCYADGSGRIEVQSITGNSPYSIAWSSTLANGSQDNITASQFDITNLPAGNYTVVVTDANQCSDTATVAVAEHDSLVAMATLTAPIKCHGDEFGVTATASGGYLEAGHNYSYNWNNNVNVQTQNNLSEYGTYFVTVSDDNGCEATASVGAVEPAQLQIAIASDAILCNGQTTTVTVTGTGGTGAYSGTGTFENISASATPYTYTITDENNCSASNQILVTEPDALSVAFSNMVDQTCQTLGSVDFSIVGGTGNISYSWDGGNIGAYTSAATISLSSGTHSISVSDANGCTTEQSVSIGSGVSMTMAVPDTTHVLCNGGNNGAFSIEIDNGTSPYSISWTSGVFVENSSSHTFEDLLAGTYSVTVNDANGCLASASVVITEPQPLVASSPAAQILCHGGNATVTVSAVGGVSPYQNTGAYTLSAGDYDYVVTDANGCQSSVHVHLSDPSALSVTATTVDAQCNGGNGSAHLQISGGNSPYSVQWQDNSIGVNNTNLPVNTNFGYTVTDINGCTEQGTVSASQPESLVLELSTDSVSCYGLADGSVTIAALSGGTQPYSYLWNNGYQGDALSEVASGDYILTVSDAHGCSITANAMVPQPSELSVVAMATNVNCGVSAGSLRLNVFGGTSPYTYMWSNGSQSDTQTDITEGVYSVTVADEAGCSATSSANVGVIGSIAVSIDEVSPISCYGMSDASISVVAENVQMPASYIWDNGLVETTLTGLDAGSYSVTVSDAWGCLGTASHRIVSPTEITIVSQVVNPLCYKSVDGAIAVEVGGGRPPYSYMWTDGSTGSNLTNLCADVYGLVVTDYDGCSVSRTFTLTAPQEIDVETEVTDVSCFGLTNGTITISAAGGVEPYMYGVGNDSTMQGEGLFEHLAAGIYNAVVSDANGCVVGVQVSVSQPEQIDMSVVVTEPTCRDKKDGIIEILASGGTLPYEYALDSNVSDTSLFEGLGSGKYSVVVTDANGCFVIERGIVVPFNSRDCIEIPDVFTPNGDGINDEWIIENIDMFPETHIYVFNRWGQLLYKGMVNDAPWDGRFRGHYVPAGVYTYIVDLGEDLEKYEGTVTVIY